MPSTADVSMGMDVGTVIGISISTTLFIAFCVTLTIALRLSLNYQRLVNDLESRGIEVPRFGVRDTTTRIPGRYRTVLTKAHLRPISKYQWTHLDSSDSILHNGKEKGMIEHYRNWPKKPEVSFARRGFLKQPVVLGNIDVNVVHESNQPSARMEYLSNTHSPPLERELHSDFCFPAHHVIVMPSNGDVEEYISSPYITTETENDMQEDLKPMPLFSPKSKGLISSEPEIRVRKKRSETLDGYSHHKKSTLPDSALSGTKQHSRSFSLGNPDPGKAPLAPVPPLPDPKSMTNDFAKPKIWLDSRDVMKINSQHSFSSLESISSSFLTNSPKLLPSKSSGLRRGNDPRMRNSAILGPGPLRKARGLHQQSSSWSGQRYLDLTKSHRLNYRHSLSSSIGKRDSITSRPESIVEEVETLEEPQIKELLKPPKVHMNRSTKKEIFITPGGSPAEKSKADLARSLSGYSKSPQSGVSSTRSSNGNPFHWDPTPLNISKISSMRGSPSSRRKQKRRLRVRLSKPIDAQNPPSPSMIDITEESTPEDRSKISAFKSTCSRPLPRPPSSSTFEPDIRSNLSCLKASLTPSSPMLQMAGYSQDSDSGGSFGTENSIDLQNQKGMTSMLAHEIPKFPLPTMTGAVANFRFISTSDTSSCLKQSIAEDLDVDQFQIKVADALSNNLSHKNVHGFTTVISGDVAEDFVSVVNEAEEDLKISPIRQSIAFLRRMNSDVKADSISSPMKGPERYLHFGPLPRKTGESPDIESSWISLTAEKALYRNKSQIDISQPLSNCDKDPNKDDYTIEAGNHGDSQNTGFTNSLRDDSASDLLSQNFLSSVTVWEDGEDFWTRLTGTKTSGTSKNETKALGNSSPLRVNILPPSNEATPQSLYDKKGFLVEKKSEKLRSPIM